MSAQSFLAKLGTRLGTLGSAATLAFAFPLAEGAIGTDAHTAAGRMGWYASRAAGTEKIGCVVMGSEGFSVNATGATVGSGGLQTDIVSGSPSYAQGRVFYDNQSCALSYYNDIDGVTVNLGQESLIRIKNDTGSQINNGVPVYISGSTGTHLNVGLADAASDLSHKTIGLTTHDINTNPGYGYITTQGLVHDMDTLNIPGSAIGAEVYVAEGGGLTCTAPVWPNHKVSVGYIARRHQMQGELFVDTHHDQHFDQLYGVNLTTPANNDILTYDGSRWVNRNTIAVNRSTTVDLALAVAGGNTQLATASGQGTIANLWDPDGEIFVESSVYGQNNQLFLTNDPVAPGPGDLTNVAYASVNQLTITKATENLRASGLQNSVTVTGSTVQFTGAQSIIAGAFNTVIVNGGDHTATAFYGMQQQINFNTGTYQDLFGLHTVVTALPPADGLSAGGSIYGAVVNAVAFGSLKPMVYGASIAASWGVVNSDIDPLCDTIIGATIIASANSSKAAVVPIPEMVGLVVSTNPYAAGGTFDITEMTGVRIASNITGAAIATHYALKVVGGGKIVTDDTTASTNTTSGSFITAGGIGVGAASYFGGNVAIQKTDNTTVGLFIDNFSTGTSARARLTVRNDTADAQLLAGVDGSAYSGTRFGIVGANYTHLFASGPSSAGLFVGCPTIDKPIIFGINTSEVARFVDATSKALRTQGGIQGVTVDDADGRTLTTADHKVRYTGTGGHTWTLPAANAGGPGGVAVHLIIKNAGSGNLTVQRAGLTDTIFTTTAGNTSFILAPGEAVICSSNGDTVWDIT